MGIYVKKDGRIFVIYSENKKRVWKPFGRCQLCNLGKSDSIINCKQV